MRNSRIWSHFRKMNGNRCECIHCEKMISKNGGTSNLIKHLARKHPECFANLNPENPNNFNMQNHSIFEDEEKVKTFINMIQVNPSLYKKSNEKELTDHEIQICDSFWEELSPELQISEMECRKIWKYLRGQYELYFKTKKPNKCKYINDLKFLDKYLKPNYIDKAQIKIVNNKLEDNSYKINKRDESKKILISIPEISDTPIHEISVNKSELVDDDDNSTQDYEILYDDYGEDPILVKSQAVEDQSNAYQNNNYDDDDDGTNLQTTLTEQGDWNNSLSNISRHSDSKQERNKRLRHQQLYTEEYANSSYNNKLYDLHYSNKRTLNKLKNENYGSPLKKMKKPIQEMDEIDYFFEFLQIKLRKMEPDTVRNLQLKFMETIQEAEVRSRNRLENRNDISNE